jgi:hypothetical protein
MFRLLTALHQIIYLIILLALASGNGKAQSLTHQQYWIDINPNFTLTNKINLATEIGYRTEPTINIRQTYFRGFLKFDLHDKVKLSVGAAEFVSWRERDFKSTELRLEQYFTIVWPKIGGFKFTHRFGVNQRWFSYPESNSLFVCRSRYRLGLHSPKFSVLHSSDRFYASASVEFLRNINTYEDGQWFDHEWVTAVVGAEISKRVKLEGHLLLINRNLPESHDFLREASALRLRIFYNIP